ncbi:hypothetical protein N752_13975 [Desulforamulus aquiferis]|nr:hypothetical protein [Desulforamulus aquiferis]RYD04476.1 hypothetical protein N752_13975 [Desulforamulus aquiferis]
MPEANIQEIFSSIQGEGPYVGCRQIFIRFTGCNWQCATVILQLSRRNLFPWKNPRTKGFYNYKQSCDSGKPVKAM